MKEKELSIIVPTYQGGKWIKNTINTLLEAFPYAEIIVVNDGSNDETSKIKDIFGERIVYLENKKNRGKGYSLRKGFATAQGKYIIFTDADLPFGLEAIEKVLGMLREGNPVVIGTREKFYNNTFYKSWLRPGLYSLLHFLFGLSYRDTQCGLKGFSQQAGKEILPFTIVNRFAIDIEMLFLAKKKHFPVKEVLVEQEVFTPSTFNMANIIKMFFDLLTIRFHYYGIK